MKKTDEKYIESLMQTLQDHTDSLEEAKGKIQDILDSEQEKFDGKSEKWQEGDAGQTAQEMLNKLESAVAEMDTASCSCDIARGDLEELMSIAP